MDAKIHNESERYLLKAISELQKYVGCDISVRVEAKNEGDIIDNLLLICDKIDISGILTALLAGFVGLFFRPAIHKTDEIKNRIEIAEKIKSGDFSKEEAEILLQGDKQLKKWISKYYEVLSKEETITKIEANIPTGDNQNNTVTIEKRFLRSCYSRGNKYYNRDNKWNNYLYCFSCFSKRSKIALERNLFRTSN